MNPPNQLSTRESLLYRRAIIDSPEILVGMDNSYSYIFASKAFLRYMGFSKASIIGRSMPEVLGYDLFERELRPHIDRGLNGKTVTFEIPFSHSRLGDRVLRLKCYPIRGVNAIVVKARDITASKRRERILLDSQRLYRLIMEKSKDILLIMNPDYIIVSCSRHSDGIIGLSSEMVVGHSVQSLLTPESFGAVIKHVTEWKRHRGRSMKWEVGVVGRGGLVVPFEINSSPVYEKGELKLIVIIARNISGWKNMERALKNKQNDIQKKLDIVARKAEESLREAEERLQRFSQKMLKAQEKERNAIGRELHDELGGYLSLLRLTLSKMANQPDRNVWLEEINKATDEMIERVRTLSHQLYPVVLEYTDLPGALATYLANYRQHTGIDVEYQHKGIDERLPLYVEATIYRIVQEALTNVAKHAQARNVSVSLNRVNDVIVVHIKDDGKGFDVSKTALTGFGITGMKDRAFMAGGSLLVDSSPGKGTMITCELPIFKTAENDEETT